MDVAVAGEKVPAPRRLRRTHRARAGLVAVRVDPLRPGADHIEHPGAGLVEPQPVPDFESDPRTADRRAGPMTRTLAGIHSFVNCAFANASVLISVTPSGIVTSVELPV